MSNIVLCNGYPTVGAVDGALVSSLNPIAVPDLYTVGADTFSSPVKLAARSVLAGYQRVGVFTIELIGATAALWQLAPDNSGSPGAWQPLGSSLVLSGPITPVNTVFWARAKVLASESVAVATDDLSVLFRTPDDVTAGAPVGQSWILRYNVGAIAAVGRSWALPYGVLAAVGRSWALPYGIIAAVGRSWALPYGIAAPWTDDFTRADATTLGANWSILTTASSGSYVAAISSNQMRLYGGPNGDDPGPVLAYTAAGVLTDQRVKWTFKAGVTAYVGEGPAARISSDGLGFYHAYVADDKGSVGLYKRVSGAWTQLGSTYTHAFTAGDQVELLAIGTSISVKVNGTTVIGPVTDSVYASGYGGFRTTTNHTSSNNGTWDDFVLTSG